MVSYLHNLFYLINVTSADLVSKIGTIQILLTNQIAKTYPYKTIPFKVSNSMTLNSNRINTKYTSPFYMETRILLS